jgi:hypothetical protein
VEVAIYLYLFTNDEDTCCCRIQLYTPYFLNVAGAMAINGVPAAIGHLAAFSRSAGFPSVPGYGRQRDCILCETGLNTLDETSMLHSLIRRHETEAEQKATQYSSVEKRL